MFLFLRTLFLFSVIAEDLLLNVLKARVLIGLVLRVSRGLLLKVFPVQILISTCTLLNEELIEVVSDFKFQFYPRTTAFTGAFEMSILATLNAPSQLFSLCGSRSWLPDLEATVISVTNVGALIALDYVICAAVTSFMADLIAFEA